MTSMISCSTRSSPRLARSRRLPFRRSPGSTFVSCFARRHREASSSRRCRSSVRPRKIGTLNRSFPVLSDRHNIVVVADEAHRTQYDLIDGLARNLRDALPRAAFMGFTGTPIETADKDTRAIFGEYVDVYDLTQAVEDQVQSGSFTKPALPELNFRMKLQRISIKSSTRSRNLSKWTLEIG